MFRCEGSVGSKTIQKRQKHGHHWYDRREDCDEPMPGDFTRRHVRSHKLLSSVRSVAGTSGESCHNDCGGRDFTASGPQLKLNFEACTCISNLELRNYKIQVQPARSESDASTPASACLRETRLLYSCEVLDLVGFLESNHSLP